MGDADGYLSQGCVESADREHRWSLTRTWKGGDGGLVAWVMLNPSGADAENDDPTVRKCVGFARRWGFGGLVVVNLVSRRATDPRELVGEGEGELIHPVLTDDWIESALWESDAVVVAWGDGVKRLGEYGPGRVTWLRERVVELRGGAGCLGRTRSGNPRHPVRLGYATALEPWVSDVGQVGESSDNG